MQYLCTFVNQNIRPMESIFSQIANSFTNNLIAEQRYRMILDGLQVTLLITLCAVILGTLLGGLVCRDVCNEHLGVYRRDAAFGHREHRQRAAGSRFGLGLHTSAGVRTYHPSAGGA